MKQNRQLLHYEVSACFLMYSLIKSILIMLTKATMASIRFRNLTYPVSGQFQLPCNKRKYPAMAYHQYAHLRIISDHFIDKVAYMLCINKIKVIQWLVDNQQI